MPALLSQRDNDLMLSLLNFFLDQLESAHRNSDFLPLPLLPNGQRHNSCGGWHHFSGRTGGVHRTAGRLRLRKIFATQSDCRFGFAHFGQHRCRREKSCRTLARRTRSIPPLYRRHGFSVIQSDSKYDGAGKCRASLAFRGSGAFETWGNGEGGTGASRPCRTDSASSD